ncbi:MAG: hypothetical protein WD046_05045, partial [Paracoccaceae bacterium]
SAGAILVVLLGCAVWQGGRISRMASAVTLGAMVALYLGLAGVAYFAPMRISPNTELALIAQAREIDPEMQITYWGERSFSGEFYSDGRAQTTIDPAEIAGLVSNTTRDAIAVLPKDLGPVRAIMGESVSIIGQFGTRYLLVEPALNGEGS